ncbi:MAG: hypothetical protein KA765_13640 [Thermoflexales bacterium]|nr:hypothetical protein [Thermoflexales bacterium]
MNTQAVLVDTHAVPRIIIKRLSGTLVATHYVPAEVQVSGLKYQIYGQAGLSPQEIAAQPLAELLRDFKHATVFSIWGLGTYRVPGPLLTCKLAGDGLGHFTVDVEFAEDTCKLCDQFVTDQTCLRQFITNLQQLGNLDASSVTEQPPTL